MDESEPFKHSNICFLSNFPPKECGIATFTKDLVSAMNKRFNPELKSRVIALNEDAYMYNYDERVIMQINKDDIEDYINIARKINLNKKIKLICIQHEFGIFGGEYGNHLIPFLELIEKPIVVTFHSILPNPDVAKKRIVQSICNKSSAIVVMTKKAIEILRDEYGIDETKIHVIHHGIPNVIFTTQEKHKKRLGLNGRIVLSTPNIVMRKKVGKYLANPFHIKEYTNAEITTLLLSYGFEIVKNVGILEFKDNQLNTTVNNVPEEGYLLWFEAIKNV